MIFAPAHILIQLLCGYKCTSEEEDEETLDEDDLQLGSSSGFVSTVPSVSLSSSPIYSGEGFQRTLSDSC